MLFRPRLGYAGLSVAAVFSAFVRCPACLQLQQRRDAFMMLFVAAALTEALS